MSRISKAFEHKAKIAYLTAGDGENSHEYFIALANAGVNILEIGIPFSDPVADGPAIQLAMERALKSGMTTDKVLDVVSKIRQKTEVAIVLFTYFNPIYANLDAFLSKAQQVGVDGLLVVDLPYEEASELRFKCAVYGIDLISVTAPSTPFDRIEMLSSHSGGFLYYASRSGTTGVQNQLPEDLHKRLIEVKNHSALPVAVGFGVSNKEMVKQILDVADGCVIGSYFVNMVANNITPQELEVSAAEIFNVN